MPTAKRSGTFPPRILNAMRSASRCGSGRYPSRSKKGAHSWWSPANAISISGSTPVTRATRQPAARFAR